MPALTYANKCNLRISPWTIVLARFARQSIFKETSKPHTLRSQQNCHPGARRGPWIGNAKKRKLALLQAWKSRFAGLMDPQRSRDDAVQVSSVKVGRSPLRC